MIEWTAFTWEAFATLMAGGTASLAAGYVAVRQGRIIQRQTSLQEVQIRGELFDRRAIVYNAIRRHIAFIVYNGEWIKPSLESSIDFHEAIESVGFLFSNNLHLNMLALDKMVRDGIERGIYSQSETGTQEDAIASQKAFQALRRKYAQLPVQFKREMSLNIIASSLSHYVTGEGDESMADVLDDIVDHL